MKTTWVRGLLACGPLLFVRGLAAQTPAQGRVRAASELQQIFDNSQLRGWELKFAPRGAACDVLHVEGYTNLEPSMMEAMAYGTLIYGRVLPGGVNAYALSHGFRDIVYTNGEGSKYRSFGARNFTRSQARGMRICTDAIAGNVLDAGSAPLVRPATPAFEQLSWQTAKAGVQLYDGSYHHDATIVRIERAAGLIYVKFVRNGVTEPKLLDAVAASWYVRKTSTR